MRLNFYVISENGDIVPLSITERRGTDFHIPEKGDLIEIIKYNKLPIIYYVEYRKFLFPHGLNKDMYLGPTEIDIFISVFR